MVLAILATFGLVLLNAYFVVAEFAAVGARLSRLKMQGESSLLSRVALMIKQNQDLYLSSCQLGVTLASLGLGAVTEPAVAVLVDPLLRLLGVAESSLHEIAFIVSFTMSTALHIVVGEQAPKNWAINFADRALPAVSVPLVLFTYVFYPVIWLLNAASNGLIRLTGAKIAPGSHGSLPHTAEELRTLLAEGIEGGSIKGWSERLLPSAFNFGDLKVRQIMTPRTQVAYLTLNQPIGDVLRTVQRSAYSRLPLCDGDLDHIVGVINMKDLFVHLKLIPGRLKFIDERTPDGEQVAIASGLPGSAVHVIGSGDLDLQQIKKEVLFVPELLSAPKLLRQFQAKRMHMAVVVDEYGATQGIVTLEDVLEEIVGEIEDEFDVEGPPTFVTEGSNYRVNGLYPLHELVERLRLESVDAQEVSTVGGYVTRELGRLPRPGDSVEAGPFRMSVVSVHQKRVGQVLITPIPADEPAAK